MVDQSGPLHGLRVINTSRNLIGMYAGQLLADYGAEVVLVERPGGHALRSHAAWPAWSRGSKSIALDLNDFGDRARLKELALRADVLLETFRPGVAEELGLGYADLAADNPRLVYASVTAFGRDNPLSNLKGYEGVVMAKVGGYHQFSPMTDRPGPSFPSVWYCSWSAAQLILQGVFAALIERTRSGEGQRVETTMIQGVLAHDTWNWMIRLITKRFEGAYAAAPAVDPKSQVPMSWLSYSLLVAITRDGRWIQFSQAAPKLFNAFLKMMGLDGEEWKGAWESDDIDRRWAFRQRAFEVVKSKTLAEWNATFDEHTDVFAEVFRNDQELLTHPQLLHDEQVVEVQHPKLGKVKQMAPLATLMNTPGRADRPGPELNQHAQDILNLLEDARPAGSVVFGGDGLPLAGVTVLELGTFFAGPYGATILTDLGARVIKIEQLDGDPIRWQLPMPEIGAVKVLLGKESVALDINQPEGRDLVLEIARKCDLVLMTFRKGVAARVGLDEAAIRAVNPDIVYLAAVGFGTDGPYAHRPAYAPTIGAGSGMARRNIGDMVPEATDLTMEQINAGSNRLGVAGLTLAHADGFSSLGAGTALLLGLLVRELGHGGQFMRTTMLSTMGHVLSDVMVQYQDRPALLTPDPELYGFSACYRLYPAGEGWVFLAVVNDREWRAFAGACGNPALAEDPRFATQAGRQLRDAELAEALTTLFHTRTASEWEQTMIAADVACVAVAELESHALAMDPGGLGETLGIVATVPHESLDEHSRLTPLQTFSRSATRVLSAPVTGQHTAAVLKEIGLDDEAIAQLVERKIART